MRREVCTKKPWYIVTPTGYLAKGREEREIVNSDVAMPEDSLKVCIKTQQDFLREFFPSGHRINDPMEYPDIWKKDPVSGKVYRQPIKRSAFAFQKLISGKHDVHLTGNDVQFEISQGRDGDSQEEMNQEHLSSFKRMWSDMDVETHFFEAIHSWNVTADCAIVGFITKDKRPGVKTLSFLNGDTLYPQFDSVTGDLMVFGRSYRDYEIDGRSKTEWLEVWDEKYLYRFNKKIDGKNDDNLIYEIGDDFVVSGFHLVSKKEHGFPFIPVAYARRDDGPCWSQVQKLIEDYEEAFSHLCENNEAYAFPIFYYQGEGEDLQIEGNMNGAVKALAISDPEAKAGFLNGTDASQAFATQLDKAYNLIYELSFTVKPPELKSGDLPGVALKLLYSPAIECAMNDAQHLQPFLVSLVRVAKYQTGYKNNNIATMMALPIYAYIQAYVHENYTEEITNIATAVQNGFLSHQTASERCPQYPKNDEYGRIVKEKKEEQEQDLLLEIQRGDAETENAIEEQEAQARLNRGQSGNDINTGSGRKPGRPNKSGKKWDENGNNPVDDKNNWKDWNDKHK